MTVKELIKILKGFPQELEVYTAAHDHGKFETDCNVGCCELVDKSEMTEFSNDENSGMSDCFKGTPKKYVVVRP